ncbi:MAG: winged helix-turn-helix domain-containing protein [Deltaproteobacteria bacterium]|nr:winged helix-turn-helix domain-containing protein [Deltaproteobacteria bacterium]
MKQDKGNPEEILNKLFGSISRTRVLCFLFGFFGQSFYQREIMYETGLSLRPVQRELNNLVHLGIVKKQTTRNRIYYGINPDSTFFETLRAICGSIPEKGL